MANKFRTKLLYGRTGVFYDAVGIGAEAPMSGLTISGGDLRIENGLAFFVNRPVISGSMQVAVLNDITGAAIPAPPISGNYSLKSQNGVLVWVTE